MRSFFTLSVLLFGLSAVAENVDCRLVSHAHTSSNGVTLDGTRDYTGLLSYGQTKAFGSEMQGMALDGELPVSRQSIDRNDPGELKEVEAIYDVVRTIPQEYRQYADLLRSENRLEEALIADELANKWENSLEQLNMDRHLEGDSPQYLIVKPGEDGHGMVAIETFAQDGSSNGLVGYVGWGLPAVCIVE
jgi:hypothetical protein